MLDRRLSCLRGFYRRNRVRYVSNEANVLPATLFGNGKIGIAAESRLRFDEIDALRLETTDGGAAFRFVVDRDRRLKIRWLFVEKRPCEENARANLLS